MNKAKQALEAFKAHRAPSLIRAAKLVEHEVKVARESDMIFYGFSDGSVLASKGRARAHQIWVIE